MAKEKLGNIHLFSQNTGFQNDVDQHGVSYDDHCGQKVYEGVPPSPVINAFHVFVFYCRVFGFGKIDETFYKS